MAEIIKKNALLIKNHLKHSAAMLNRLENPTE
jgi:hypothetical protein